MLASFVGDPDEPTAAEMDRWCREFDNWAFCDASNFVKKAANMALRAIGKRNRALHGAAVSVARPLAASEDRAARWVGTDALRELTSPSARKRLKG